MVAKFLKADLLGRKQNRKNRKGETGAILKCKAEQSRREETTKINQNKRGLKRNENY
jgi:hypothetical protein